MTIASGKAATRAVKLGLRGGGNVEILEGLKAGEQVIVSAATVPGTRVRRHVIDSERVTQIKP